jgi:hypothetical protein
VNRQILILPLLLVTACATNKQSFNVSAPIVVRDNGLSNIYEQEGQPLNYEDMTRKLEERPATQSDIETAKTLATVGMVLGAVGGALVGWPIGAAAAGNPNPPWVLAGFGAGVIAVAIPFSIGSANYVNDAVNKHNESLESTP